MSSTSTPASTKAIVVEEFGQLTYKERPLPSLQPSQVLVQVAAAAVNPADTYICQGTYTALPPLPFTPGIEGSGRVVAVGAEVEHLEVGDPVAFSVAAADGGLAASTGTWAQYCAVEADLAVPVHPGMDLIAAAAIPVAYLTAHRALFFSTGTKNRERVLVRGASGAVGLAAIHLARHFGAPGRVVVGTASSAEGRRAIEARGGVAVGHSSDEVRQALGPGGADVILELMANVNLGNDLELLAGGGRIAVIGSRPGGGLAHVDARQALVKEATVRGVFLWKQTRAERVTAYQDVFAAFHGGDRAMPSVRRFALADAMQALEVVSAQAQGRAKTEGKVVLVPEHDRGLEAPAPSTPTASVTPDGSGCPDGIRTDAAVLQSAARSAKVIDVHAHAVLEETLGAAGAFGPEVGEADGKPWYRIGDYYLRGVQYRGSPFMDVDVRIARMDACGVDVQILSPNPLTFFHHIPADQAAGFCRHHNGALAALLRRHPRRLGGLAALPMQSPELAVQELTHAVRDLGLLGGYIGTDFGISLDDPRLDPFYAACTELDVPLFLHPAPPGIDGPAGDPRLRRFELDVVIGFNLESTVAVTTLILGGVLDRHPRLDICLPSGGGAIASVAGRLSAALAAPRPWVPPELKEEGALWNRLRRLWFDTHVHDDGVLRLLREQCGDSHLVYGSNFAGWDQDASGTRPAALHGVDLVGNARRLLHL